MPLFKDERELVRKFVHPVIEAGYSSKRFVRVPTLVKTLKREGSVNAEELAALDPRLSEIDLVFWPAKPEVGETPIHAAEVKYFRWGKRKKIAPPFWHGIGQALSLHHYGFNYVHLWNVYDPSIPTEQAKSHDELTKALVENAASSIHFYGIMLEDYTKETTLPPDWDTVVKGIALSLLHLLMVGRIGPLPYNPLRHIPEVEVRRTLIRRIFRIVD